MVSKTERALMNSPATAPMPARERLEDLEDLRELEDAKSRNGSQPGIPWEQVKAELEAE